MTWVSPCLLYGNLWCFCAGRDLNMESTEEDLSLELSIFIWNVNYRWLKALLVLCPHDQSHVDTRYKWTFAEFLFADSCITILCVPNGWFLWRAVLETQGLKNFVYKRQATNVELTAAGAIDFGNHAVQFQDTLCIPFITGMHIDLKDCGKPFKEFYCVWTHGSQN